MMRSSMAGLGVVFVLMWTAGSARADEWFLLSEQTLKSSDPSVKMTAEDGKLFKEDVKDVKISVEGADVNISKVVLHWNNRPDETIWNVGTLKSGGQTAPKTAPGHEGTLGSVTINYKILGDATSAKVKVWGYD